MPVSVKHKATANIHAHSTKTENSGLLFVYTLFFVKILYKEIKF